MPDRSNNSRRVTAVALLGGGIAAGVIGATAYGASAQNAPATSSSSTATTASTATPPSNSMRPGNGEKPVTGTKATDLRAAALKQVPGATVDGVTTDTDHTGSAYEVHVTKADGTHVDVLFDANLTYVTTQTDTGHGPGGGHVGGPGGPGGTHGGPGGGNGEKAVTGANAATLKAAALKQVPGATVEQVSTDSGDAAYEVHLKKADGSEVTAKFDKNFKFIAVEDGRGK